MNFNIEPFDPKYIDQLNQLCPDEWQSNAYDLFMHNEWQPWFHPYQLVIENKLIGFGMLFHFVTVAWLGWIIVHKHQRNKGYGAKITNHLIAEGRKFGASNFILTATELGAPIYEKAGFTTTSYYHFYKLPTNFKLNYEKNKIRKAKLNDLPTIYSIDELATGEKRDILLKAHFDDTWVFVNDKIEGYYVASIGNGLLIATTQDAGLNLFAFRIKKNKTTVVVPSGNSFFNDFLSREGLNCSYIIPRMTLGEEPKWQQDLIFCRATGYSG